MSTNECSFCKKTFSSPQNLQLHQRNAKYCRELRGENEGLHTCQYCKKEFSTNQNMQYHIVRCSAKVYVEREENYKNQIKLLEEKVNQYEQVSQEKSNQYELVLEEKAYQLELCLQEIETLKDKIQQAEAKNKENENIIHSKEIIIARLEATKDGLESTKDSLEENRDKLLDTITHIAKKPTTNTNNTTTHRNIIVNTLDLQNTEHINKKLKDNMTKEILYKGQEGVAILVQKHLLLDDDGNQLYECTDQSRQKFEYRNPEGDMVSDPKAFKLIKSLKNSQLCETFHDAASKHYFRSDGGLNDEEVLRLHSPLQEVMNIEKDSTKFRGKLSVLTAKQR